MIFVVATLNVLPDRLDEMKIAAQAVIAGTRKEEGCLAYDLHQSVSDPTTFVFVERWTTRAALNAHFEAAHLLAFRKVAANCVAKRVVEIITPASVEIP